MEPLIVLLENPRHLEFGEKVEEDRRGATGRESGSVAISG